MKTCEEYVLSELVELKKEIALLKAQKEELDKKHEVVIGDYNMLTKLVAFGTKDFRVEDDGDFYKLYWKNNFITLERKKELKEMKNLLDLIAYGENAISYEGK